ncbi:chorismate mutase [Zavarzinia sp. CC-PAN008]|uniref:chorismate mutase n=1 Tax=Zavarzinia sp. CC-PAN008 TaxID=3243332 RepID=UPI003F742F84
MTAANDSLDALREEIDGIDRALHDLLIRRSEVVQRVAQAKAPGSPMMRPGREAQVLRRILGRHHGTLPRLVVARIWREMMSAFLRVQAPLEVAVYGARDPIAYWDVARSHFGSGTPTHIHESPAQVLRAVKEKPNAVGVLPAPGTGDAESWWPYLRATGPGALRIVALLPFVTVPEGQPAGRVSAVVVAPFEAEATGEDRSYLLVASRTEVSRARVVERVNAAGFAARCIDSQPERPGEDEAWHLLEVDGFVAQDDARLAALTQSDGVSDVIVGGAVAIPVDGTHTPLHAV